MEELAIKIAETLDISVQGAIDLYPVIKDQFIWYETLMSISVWSIVFWFGSIIITGITWVIRHDTEKYDWRTEEINEEWTDIDKIFKVSLSALVLFLIVAIATEMIIPFLSPDIMLLKGLLG